MRSKFTYPMFSLNFRYIEIQSLACFKEYRDARLAQTWRSSETLEL